MLGGGHAPVAPEPERFDTLAPPKEGASSDALSRMRRTRTWVTLSFFEGPDLARRRSVCLQGVVSQFLGGRRMSSEEMSDAMDRTRSARPREPSPKEVREAPVDDLYVTRYRCCYSAFARLSDGLIDAAMENKFAQEKYQHFRGAFIQVSFLMPLGVVALAVNAGFQEQWERLGLLLGGVAPLYLAYAVFALRQEKQYLGLSGTRGELALIALLCLHGALIVVAEWVREELDYGMLAMHIGFVYNFTPLSASAMQVVTIAFGILPYAILRLLRFLQDQAKGVVAASSGSSCDDPNLDEALALGVLTPVVILLYQVFVTMRRDESLRIDSLTGEVLQRQQRLLAEEEQKNEGMLMTMLPRQLIQSLKANEQVEAQFFDDVTVIFVEICHFSRLCSQVPPQIVVEVLNIIFTEFDRLSDLLSVYKVETVGQVYMAVVGAPEPILNHADVAAHFGLAAQESMRQMRGYLDVIFKAAPRLAGALLAPEDDGAIRAAANVGNDAFVEAPVVDLPRDLDAAREGLAEEAADTVVPANISPDTSAPNSTSKEEDLKVQIRVGLNSGQIRAGVVGMDAPRYKLFGDTVNTASRMESTCEPGKVQVSPSTKQRLSENMFTTQDRGEIAVKGKGKMRTAFLTGYSGPEPTEARRIVIERSCNASFGGSGENVDEGEKRASAGVPHRTSTRLPLNLPSPGYTKDMEVMSCNSAVDGAHKAGGGQGDRSSKTLPRDHSSRTQGLEAMVNIPLAFVTEALGVGSQQVQPRQSVPFSRHAPSDGRPLTCAERFCKSAQSCWDWAETVFLLVPQDQKTPEWMAELKCDRPIFQQENLPKQLSFARNLTIILLLVLALISTLDFFLEKGLQDIESYKSTILIRALGNNVVGLAYLLSLLKPGLGRRLAQHLTMLTLMVQGASMMLCVEFLYQSEPMMIGMVAMYGAYTLFYTVCTIAQRLMLCAWAVLCYVVIELVVCGTKGVSGAAQNIAFLIVFEICMASGVHLQEHLQHVSHYEQRAAQLRLHRTKQAKQAGSTLLNNLLPPHVITKVREGVSPIAEHYTDVTIIFTDIKGFTNYSSRVTPHKLVQVLNSMYSAFDEIISNWALYKVEIIGDAYFVSSGCPARHSKDKKDNTDPAEWAMRAVEVALALQRTLPSVCDDASVQMRVGLNTGDVVAGVVGKKGPRYHLFGPAVSYAEQMESSGIPGRVQISDSTHQLLENGGHNYDFEERSIELESEEEVQRTWLVNKSNSKEAMAIKKRLMAQRRMQQQDQVEGGDDN